MWYLYLAARCIFDEWESVSVHVHDVPDRIVVLVKDLIAFSKKASHMIASTAVKDSKVAGGFMTVHYHNRGIEMIQLPRILHSKSTIPQFLNNRKLPRVSYSYTKTISLIRKE